MYLACKMHIFFSVNLFGVNPTLLVSFIGVLTVKIGVEHVAVPKKKSYAFLLVCIIMPLKNHKRCKIAPNEMNPIGLFIS